MKNTLIEAPSLLTSNELTRLRALCRGRPAGTFSALDIGCWLGKSSRVLLENGAKHLYLVDTFEWQAIHAQRLPGLLSIGEDFMPVTKATMGDFAERCHFIRANSESLDLTALAIDPRLGICLLDGPKQPLKISDTIAQLSRLHTRDMIVAIKHAASPRFFDIFDLVMALMTFGVLKPWHPDKPAATDSLLSFTINPESEWMAPDTLMRSEDWFHTMETVVSPLVGPDHLAQLCPILYAITLQDFDRATHLARRLPFSPRRHSVWLDLQQELSQSGKVETSDLIPIDMAMAASD